MYDNSLKVFINHQFLSFVKQNILKCIVPILSKEMYLKDLQKGHFCLQFNFQKYEILHRLVVLHNS